MEQNLERSLHRPDPPMPDVEPEPAPPDHDDVPPDLPEPYRHPEGDPPEHRPPEREPPGHVPPVRGPWPDDGIVLPSRVSFRRVRAVFSQEVLR